MKEIHHNIISDDKIVLYGHYKKIFSVIFAVVLGISLMSFLLLYNLKITAANPEFYKQELKKSNIYERLINEGIPSLISKTAITQDVLTNFMAQKAIIYIVKQSISSEWVEKQTDSIIDKTAEMFSQPKSTPKMVIKLDSMSTYLGQISDGILIFEQLIPGCLATETQNNISKELLGVPFDCKSMNVNLDQVKDSLKKASVTINNLKTANIDISDELHHGVESVNSLKDLIYDLNFYTWLSLALLILSIILLFWLEMHQYLSLLKYFAWPIFLASVSTLITALILQSGTLNSLANNLNFNLTPEMNSIIYDFANSSTMQFFFQVKIVSVILLVISLAVLIFVKIKTRNPAFVARA